MTEVLDSNKRKHQLVVLGDEKKRTLSEVGAYTAILGALTVGAVAYRSELIDMYANFRASAYETHLGTQMPDAPLRFSISCMIGGSAGYIISRAYADTSECISKNISSKTKTKLNEIGFFLQRLRVYPT